MKKYLLGIVFFLISANIAFSGPFELFNMSDTVRSKLYVDGDGELVGDELAAYAQLRNTTDSEVEFDIKMTFLEMTSGHSAALCWGECFPFTDKEFISPWPYKLGAKQESKVAQFSGHLLPYKLLSESPLVYSKSVTGLTKVRYSFIPVGGSTEDEIHFDAVFIVEGPVSVDDADLTINGIYPNPSNNIIQVELGSEIVAGTTLTILDMSGKIVGEHIVTNGSQNQALDVSTLAVGNYILTISNGSTITSKKFNVSR